VRGVVGIADSLSSVGFADQPPSLVVGVCFNAGIFRIVLKNILAYVFFIVPIFFINSTLISMISRFIKINS
jgi:hypothetical protein